MCFFFSLEVNHGALGLMPCSVITIIASSFLRRKCEIIIIYHQLAAQALSAEKKTISDDDLPMKPHTTNRHFHNITQLLRAMR